MDIGIKPGSPDFLTKTGLDWIPMPLMMMKWLRFYYAQYFSHSNGKIVSLDETFPLSRTTFTSLLDTKLYKEFDQLFIIHKS